MISTVFSLNYGIEEYSFKCDTPREKRTNLNSIYFRIILDLETYRLCILKFPPPIDKKFYLHKVKIK